VKTPGKNKTLQNQPQAEAIKTGSTTLRNLLHVV